MLISNKKSPPEEGKKAPSLETIMVSDESGRACSIYRGRGLHIGVIRPTATFGGHPLDVLAGIFDITGFTMQAVLRIDLKRFTGVIFDHFIDPRRAVALCGFVIEWDIYGERDLLFTEL